MNYSLSGIERGHQGQLNCATTTDTYCLARMNLSYDLYKTRYLSDRELGLVPCEGVPG